MLLMVFDLRVMAASNSPSATSCVACYLIFSSLSFLIQKMGMLTALNSQDSCKCSIKLAISTLGSLHSLPSSRQNCEPLCSLPTPPLKSLMLSLAELGKLFQTGWLVFSTIPGVMCILKRALGCASFKGMRTLEPVNSAQGS